MPPKCIPIEQRLWPRVDKISSANGCWEWTGPTLCGYGRISWNGHVWKTHRAAWTILVGPIPDNLFICHKCDNPRCVNPDHLFLGTQKENMADAADKDRVAFGKRNGRTRLSENMVKNIVHLISSGEMSQTLAARKFGVSITHICAIVHGRKRQRCSEVSNSSL